jgi:hypothetical protein
MISEEKNKSDWMGLAKTLEGAVNSIRNFYEQKLPIKFTEEGEYEMANGETVNIKIDLDNRIHLKDTQGHMKWNTDGSVIHEDNKIYRGGSAIVRYLGKKKFTIDKPGVYVTKNGRPVSFLISEKILSGRFLDNNHTGVWLIDGYCTSHPESGNNHIVKFLSSTWNFEKGEPA